MRAALSSPLLWQGERNAVRLRPTGDMSGSFTFVSMVNFPSFLSTFLDLQDFADHSCQTRSPTTTQTHASDRCTRLRPSALVPRPPAVMPPSPIGRGAAMCGCLGAPVSAGMPPYGRRAAIADIIVPCPDAF